MAELAGNSSSHSKVSRPDAGSFVSDPFDEPAMLWSISKHRTSRDRHSQGNPPDAGRRHVKKPAGNFVVPGSSLWFALYLPAQQSMEENQPEINSSHFKFRKRTGVYNHFHGILLAISLLASAHR